MRSSFSGFAQLYYNADSGDKEADSVRLPLQGGNRDVDYKFRLPEGTYSLLKFNPTDRPGNVMTLSQMRIVTGAGRLVRAIEPNQVKASQQIERLEPGPTSMSLTTTSSADNPILSLELREPLVLKSFARASWRTLVRRFLLSFPITFALGLLLTSVIRLLGLNPTACRWAVAIRIWSTNHPQQAVLVVAALFVALSCYPVVFFGKSFVSPNNHNQTYLLYGKMPTVPGYQDIETDDEKGSDLGAIMWQNWPYAVVEARALFKDGELPLWNRYNSTGLPLLGQGLSMCADPLQLIVLIGGGSSAAWDLKYILAKFLFAACIGLCVFQAARHLPAALIIAGTAPFIGFFSYRYSHPAFFSLCYAPAVLLCWFKFIDSRPGKATALWLGAMVLADWTLINGGGLKEAYILFLALNFCGLVALLSLPKVDGKGRKLFQVFLAKLLFVAISMPVWLTFFHALHNSFTVYDAGGACQITPGLLIGLFDDMFYRQFNLDEAHLDPSLNFLTLLGVLWLFSSPRRPDPGGLSRSLTITSLVALTFVFGVVPASWIMHVPFLKSIDHIDNAFSCVVIVCLLMLAGFGVKAFWNDCRTGDFKRSYVRVTILLLVLCGLYFGTTQALMRSSIPISQPLPKSNFFWGYFVSLMLSAFLLPWFARSALSAGRARIVPFATLFLLFLLTHWRHGMHLATPFDAYVMNPQRRINLMADSSAALQLVKTHTTEPSRTVGLDWVFSPGYGGAVGIEQMDGPDPILNKYYRALLEAAGVQFLFDSWRVGVVEDQLASEPTLFNMLNVRYYLGSLGPSVTLAPSLTKVASLDMGIYESERVWPRAFFTDKPVAYEHESDFIALLKTGDGAPFAAIPREELNNRKELTALAGSAILSTTRQVTPARDYVLTSNTTSFKVSTPGPGVVVLTEAFVPDDFQVQLNGKPAGYFRINSAFKGLFLKEAGEYTVSYTYWPRYFTLSLLVAGGAAAVLISWLAVMAKGGPRRTILS
jgi:hypothetical protein